jgi:probable F420-dependent oxidoreductase
VTEATSIGVTFAGFMPLGPQAGVEVAREAAALGFGSYWTAETTGTEAFSLLSAVNGVAPQLDLGTGVLALQLRTPQVTAMAAATLQALAPERDVLLGIGISSPVVVGQWHGTDYGDRPLAQVREYVALVREILTGESVTFDGDFYSAKRFRLGLRLGERRPKIVIGALNPKMLALAGEVADGVLLNYLPASHVPWSVEQVRKGGDAEVYAYVHVGVADRDAAAENARKDLFSYAVVDAYARNFERAGFGDSDAEVRERHQAKDREGAVAAISDDFVDAIDFMGTAGEVAAFARSYVDAGVDVPILMPLPWGPDRRQVIDDTMRAFVS